MPDQLQYERDFQTDICIDKHSLDHEWLQQAEKYAYYSQIAVESVYIRDKAKMTIETVEATVEKEIRSTPVKFGLTEKVTEAAIRAVLVTDRRVLEAREAYLEAVKNAALANSAQQAIGDLKKSLEYLTQLFLSHYWAEPRLSSDLAQKAVAIGAEGDTAQHRESLQGSRVMRRKAAGDGSELS